MKICVLKQNEKYFAVFVEENGDEFELASDTSITELQLMIAGMGIYKDVEIEYCF